MCVKQLTSMRCSGNPWRINLSPGVRGLSSSILKSCAFGVTQGDRNGLVPILSTCWLVFRVPLNPAVRWMSRASNGYCKERCKVIVPYAMQSFVAPHWQLCLEKWHGALVETSSSFEPLYRLSCHLCRPSSGDNMWDSGKRPLKFEEYDSNMALLFSSL